MTWMTRIKKARRTVQGVNVNEPYELQRWIKRFGVSAEQLKAAVAKVSVSVTAVEQYLKDNRHKY